MTGPNAWEYREEDKCKGGGRERTEHGGGECGECGLALRERPVHKGHSVRPGRDQQRRPSRRREHLCGGGTRSEREEKEARQTTKLKSMRRRGAEGRVATSPPRDTRGVKPPLPPHCLCPTNPVTSFALASVSDRDYGL